MPPVVKSWSALLLWQTSIRLRPEPNSTPVGKSAITKLDSISRAHPVHRSRSVFARPAPTGTACLPTRPGI